MRIAEMLSYADIEQLHQLARAYECDCNIHSKNELIQSLLSSIKRSSVIEQQINGLAPAELHFLMHIVFDNRNHFTIEDLRAKAKFSYVEELDRDTYRKLVSVALRKGWIFRGVSREAKASFVVPSDMRELWIDAILQRELTERPSYSAPNAYREEGGAMIEDIRVFLRYIERHDPALTMEGVIYRRNQQQILALFSVKEELIEKDGGWRFGYGRYFKEYPDRFSLIYDFCYYKGYIREAAGERLYVTPNAAEVEQLPEEWIAKELYKFWLRLYKRPIVGLPMFSRAIGEAAKDWICEQTLLRLLLPRARTYYYDPPDQIVKQRILKMMVHLGLLRQGRLESGLSLYQTTELGRALLASIEGSAMKDIVLDPVK